MGVIEGLLLNDLPLVAEDLIDDLHKLVAAKGLQRIKVPAGLFRDFVRRFTLFCHGVILHRARSMVAVFRLPPLWFLSPNPA